MDLRILRLDDFPDDAALAKELRRRGLGLKPEETRKVRGILGRDPTQTELCVFDTQWSEHCSYKSSRRVLKAHLPTEGPEAILGPSEDSGILYLCTHDGERYGLVISHESHNHPSQVLPVVGVSHVSPAQPSKQVQAPSTQAPLMHSPRLVLRSVSQLSPVQPESQ